MCANCQGLKLTLTTQTLIWWLSIAKQYMFSYITNHLTVPLHFFCIHICLLQELHTTKSQVIWCSGLSDPAHGCLKSRVHAAANLAYAPSLATVKPNCHGHHLEPSLTVANDGAHMGTFEKHPHLGGQSPPSGRICLHAYAEVSAGYLLRDATCRKHAGNDQNKQRTWRATGSVRSPLPPAMRARLAKWNRASCMFMPPHIQVAMGWLATLLATSGRPPTSRRGSHICSSICGVCVCLRVLVCVCK